MSEYETALKINMMQKYLKQAFKHLTKKLGELVKQPSCLGVSFRISLENVDLALALLSLLSEFY